MQVPTGPVVSVGSAPSDDPNAEPFVQGHVQGRVPLQGEPESFSAVVSTVHYDRCHFDQLQAFSSGGFELFEAPARVGQQDTGSVGASGGSLGAGLSRVEITRFDQVAIEGRLDGRPFVLDTCGHFGQSDLKLQGCLLDEAIDPTGIALSPEGRLAVADFDARVRVFKRSAEGPECRYQLDVEYGNGGELGIASLVRALAFDGQERLYGSSEGGLDNWEPPGHVFIAEPGGALRACRNNSEASAVVTDAAGERLTVLRDGSAAFIYWGAAGEWKIVTDSGAFGDGSIACEAGKSSSGDPFYTAALGVHDGGLLFLRRQGDPFEGILRAEVTDLELQPLLRFGGTTSGAGSLGFADTRAGARCPPGYCMANSQGLSIFDAQGAPRIFLRWSSELSAGVQTRVAAAIEGNAGDAFFLLRLEAGWLGVRLSPAG
ncbi:MAG: hypothetical protein OEZ06_17405 [Myxococcales bacterium]|nr:hypothetical protein [Myxococcales bacterium]